MAIYVDEFPGDDWGKWNGGGHMTCTNIFELHSMARRIGLRKSWFQKKRIPHYDLTASKRRLALKHGAVHIEIGEIPDDTLVRRKTGGYVAYGDRR